MLLIKLSLSLIYGWEASGTLQTSTPKQHLCLRSSQSRTNPVHYFSFPANPNMAMAILRLHTHVKGDIAPWRCNIHTER